MSIQNAFIVPHPPLIIPEIGKGEEGKVQKTLDAYEKVASIIAKIMPETVVVATPHSVLYKDYIHISSGRRAEGHFGRFGASNVSISKEYDEVFIDKLCDVVKLAGVSAGTVGNKDQMLDHGVLVPLYFIDQQYTDYQLVRISISGLSFLDHYTFGQCIAKTSDAIGRKVVFIASGDLSHKLTPEGPYGFAKEGPEFDNQVTQAIRTGDFMRFLAFDEDFCDAAAECGLRTFIEMAGALDGRSVKTDFLSYEGPFGVGYAVCTYSVTGRDGNRQFAKQYEEVLKKDLVSVKSAEDEYVRLARLSLETYVKNGEYAKAPTGLPKELTEKQAGVFVTLKKDGHLRGCIGTIAPNTLSIAEEIIKNAVSAGQDDPRFDAVTADELPFLVYSVDVLGIPEVIVSIKKLDVKRYGVIVTKGYRRGLLLPNLEGVDTPEQQVAIALQKAGISASETYQMERFEVVRHK
ncbi:MAG: AmmeMemoRadiSam system protein A [Christensenellales bacterium]